MPPIGLYVHVPFCLRKCDYCDFYSLPDLSLRDAFVAETARRLAELDIRADTLYFGGGTPSLLGERGIAALLNAAHPFLEPGCEITVEANPGDDLEGLIPSLVSLGVNRLSLGMQSHDDAVLRRLSRRHSAADVDRAVEAALRSGVERLSLDVMIGTPGQTEESLLETLDYAAQCGADHISAYLLKVEPGTPFARRREELSLPDEDEMARRYLLTVERLAASGFAQYEISNFSRPGCRSRHNMKYWLDEPYLGFGPAAHSYFQGKRYYFPRDLASYLRGGSAVPDGEGGGLEEYAMLRLRLTDGLSRPDMLSRYPEESDAVDAVWKRAERFRDSDLLRWREDRLSLTPEGFLVSNALIAALLVP